MIDLEAIIPCPSCGLPVVRSYGKWRCSQAQFLCGWTADAEPTLCWYASGNHVVRLLLHEARADAQRTPPAHELANLRDSLARVERQRDRNEDRADKAERQVGDLTAEVVRLREELDARGLRARVLRWWGRWPPLPS